MKKIIKTIFILITLLILVSCEIKEGNKINLDELINQNNITFVNKGDDFDYLTGDIHLKTKFDKQGLVTVKWESSDDNIIDLSGKVTLQETDVSVTLTLTLTFNEKSLDKDYDFVVIGKEHFYITIDDEELPFDNLPNSLTLEAADEIYGYDFLYYLDEDGRHHYPGDEVDGPISLTSYYELKIYSVIFYLNDEIYLEQAVKHGELIDIIDNPTIDYGEFLGWEIDNEPLDFELEVISDLRIDANIKLNTYNVQFYIEDELYMEFEIEHGYLVEEFDSPVIEHLDFLGWLVGDSTFSFNNPITTNLRVDANVQIKTYDVNFYVRGRLYKDFIVEHGNLVESFDDPVIDYGEFLGWEVDGESFYFEDPIVSNLRVEAIVEMQTFNVNYYLNGELYETREVEALSNAKFIDLYEDGYNFDYWYREIELYNMFNFYSTITEDTNVYAVKEQITIYDVMSKNKEGTFLLIAYVTGIFNKYTYISDEDGYSEILDRPSKPSNLLVGDKVLVEFKTKLSGGMSYLDKSTIKKVISKDGFELDNIEYDYSLKVFDDTHLGRRFNFDEIEIYEVDNYYLYGEIVNDTTYPRVYKFKIDHSYLNKSANDLMYLKHKRIKIDNIYLHDIYYYSGYTLTFNLYNINDFERLDLNDKEKIDDAYDYLVDYMTDNISEGNLILPTSHNDTLVEWSSNKPNIISNDGVVHYENMTGLEDVVRLSVTLSAGDEVYTYLYFDITVINGNLIITNTITFGNVGLKTTNDYVYYVDKNGIEFTFNYIKKRGSSFIINTDYDSQMYVEFPNGLIDYSFKYRVQSSRPLRLYAQVNQDYPFKNLYYDEFELNKHVSNQIYTYVHTGSSYINQSVTFMMFLNDHGGLFELEVLEFTYRAIRG